MGPFLGMFFSRKARALQGFYDAPYLMMGRHVLSGFGYATDGGAAALAVGWMRNADELRARLRASGLNPEASLSALLLSAYRLWGEDCVTQIEGPVLSVIIDQDSDRLLLATDRMGEAGPVFYAARGGSVSFASHPAPLLEAPGVSRVVDADGWREVFGLGPARTPGRTPFRDIRQLPPGCLLLADDRGMSTRRYFQLEARPHTDDLATTIRRTRELTLCAAQNAARFQPACMLSGGLDSTVLAALLAREACRPLRTYSVDYEGNERHFAGGSYQPEQDAPYVEKAVRAIGCSHTRVILRVESLAEALQAAMEARGFPGMADIDSSLLLFSRRIASEARHVVSGECADEVFGGYPWFRREELIDQDGFPWSGSVALRSSILRSDVQRTLRLSDYVAKNYRQALARQSTLPGENAREQRLRQLQGLCFEYFMSNLQERAATMGAAAGLTVLTPYCDDRLVQYLYNVPWAMKSLENREKGLLRRAMEGLLPDELLWRKKSPYPKTYHPLYAQLICAEAEEILADPAAPILQLIDREAVSALIRGPLAPTDTPWFGQLMNGAQMLAYLIQVNQWMLRYRVEVALE